MAHGPSLEERASAARQKSVFLSLPNDARFRSLFLAYVAGTSAFGLIPRATLEIPGSARHLPSSVPIRKRLLAERPVCDNNALAKQCTISPNRGRDGATPVSYTHLTLPTICSV